MPSEQVPLPRFQVCPPGVVLRHAGQLALHADELATWIIPLVEPVRIDEPQALVVGVLDNGLNESVVLSHEAARVNVIGGRHPTSIGTCRPGSGTADYYRGHPATRTRRGPRSPGPARSGSVRPA